MPKKTPQQPDQNLRTALNVLSAALFIVSIVFSNFLGATGVFSFIPVSERNNSKSSSLNDGSSSVAFPTSVVPSASGQNAQQEFKVPSAPDESMVRHWEGQKDAPVTVIVWADPRCSYCKQFHDQIYVPVLKDRILSGEVRFGYMPFVFLGEQSNLAANAAECAAENNADFFAFMDKVFSNQNSYTKEDLINWAKELGANAPTMESCIENKAYMPRIQETNEYIQSIGGQYTPTLFVDGQFVENWYDAGTMAIYIENKTGNIGDGGIVIEPTEETPAPPTKESPAEVEETVTP